MKRAARFSLALVAAGTLVVAAGACKKGNGGGGGGGGGGGNGGSGGGGGSGLKLVLSGLAATTTTSTPVMVHVAVKKSDGSAATSYTGTIALTSSDAVAYLPAQYTFTAADAGGHDFPVTFNTVGTQTLTGTDANGAPSGSATTTVAGPAYYYADAPGGKIRLVHNAALSTPTAAALDLVAVVDLTGYFVGFDLAVDATKLAPGSDLITAGSALSPGSSPTAMSATIPSSGPLANALVSGLSQKATGTGAVATDSAVPAGSVFYTLKLPLKSGATAGTLFDGTVAANKIRAGLRNKAGSEVVGVADFSIGKLVYAP